MTSKGIRFLHTIDPELIDHLCKTSDFVQVTIAAYNYEEIIHPDGTDKPPRSMELSKTLGATSQIKSSKDIVQFNSEDMKVLTEKTKKELR
jgi:hypothetical protein